MKRKVISFSLVLMLLLNVAFPNVSLLADTETAEEKRMRRRALRPKKRRRAKHQMNFKAKPRVKIRTKRQVK